MLRLNFIKVNEIGLGTNYYRPTLYKRYLPTPALSRHNFKI